MQARKFGAAARGNPGLDKKKRSTRRNRDEAPRAHRTISGSDKQQ